MNDFSQFISNAVPAVPPLPAMHTTDGLGFRNAFRTCTLTPCPCPVFNNEKILYLFYGRPAYRMNSIEGGSVNSNVAFPVCFILHPDCIETAKRVYPFDTGAFVNNLFSQFIYEKYTVDNFLITSKNSDCIPCPDMPSRIVTSFFGDNYSYFWGKYKSSVQFSAFDMEAKDYYELIKSRNRSCFDDRRATIEIQTDEIVKLSRSTVCAVALPQTYMEDETISRKIIKEWDAEPLIYHAYLSNPSDFTTVIIEKVGDYLINEGLIEV